MNSQDRLDSWKEIASYLRRGVRTVQRWERVAGLPVRRIASERGAIYAFRSELDAWWLSQGADIRRNDVEGSDLRRAVAHAVAAELRESSPPNIENSTPADQRSVADRSMRVREFLSHAITVDPESALSHANLAIYFFTLVAVGLLRPAEGMPAARAAAQRAIDLDPSMTDAHAVSAIVAGVYDGNWREADRRFRLALEQEPVPPTVHFHYAIWYLSPLGRHAEALVHLRRGLVEDPLYLLGRAQVAVELCSLGNVNAGLTELEHLLEIDASFGPALGLLGREYAICGRVGEALELAKRTYAAIPRHPNAVGFLAGMLRRTGNPEQAGNLFESFARSSAWALPRARSESHIVCTEFEAAVAAAAAAVDQRDPGIWLLFAGTSGNMMRSSSKWPTLRGRLNVPEQ